MIKSFKDNISANILRFISFVFFICIFFFSLPQSQPKVCAKKIGQTSSGKISKGDYNSYYRAIIVLKSLDKLSRNEEEFVPRGLIHKDEVENLLHHPDQLFVLRQVGNDLALASGFFPKAKLFEAYARLALGERNKAVDLLASFMGDGGNNEAKHYEVLCTNLLLLEDWLSLYIFSLEWKEWHPGCNPQRIEYSWKALRGLKKYSEAEKLAGDNKKCLGWKWFIYAASSAMDAGNEEAGAAYLRKSYERHPELLEKIDSFWAELRAWI